jgi:hypothetical protein
MNAVAITMKHLRRQKHEILAIWQKKLIEKQEKSFVTTSRESQFEKTSFLGDFLSVVQVKKNKQFLEKHFSLWSVAEFISLRYCETMKYFNLFVVVAVVAFLTFNEAKTFRTCELARALANEGVPRVLISNCNLKVAQWFSKVNFYIAFLKVVCLAEAVSASTTNKMVKASPTSEDYGIFQINTKEYCGKNGKAGGKCNIQCESEWLKLFSYLFWASNLIFRIIGRCHQWRYSVCQEDSSRQRIQALASMECALQIYKTNRLQQISAQLVELFTQEMKFCGSIVLQ